MLRRETNFSSLVGPISYKVRMNQATILFAFLLVVGLNGTNYTPQTVVMSIGKWIVEDKKPAETILEGTAIMMADNIDVPDMAKVSTLESYCAKIFSSGPKDTAACNFILKNKKVLQEKADKKWKETKEKAKPKPKGK